MPSRVTLYGEKTDDDYVRFVTKDGVPTMEIWRLVNGEPTLVMRRDLSSATVNVLREWTEEAYPRGQER